MGDTSTQDSAARDSLTLEERIATADLRAELAKTPPVLMSDFGRTARGDGAAMLVAGALLLVVAVATLRDAWLKNGGQADASLLLSLAPFLLSLSALISGLMSVGRVNHLTLSVADRTFQWRHGTWPSVTTATGTFDAFTGLVMEEKRLRHTFPTKGSSPVYTVWRLSLRGADGVSLPLSFFELRASEISEARAKALAEAVADRLDLPLLPDPDAAPRPIPRPFPQA